MKSREDFILNENWEEYLKHYYAGLAMQAICSHYMMFTEKDRDKNLDIAVELSKQLIQKLSK